MQFAHNLKQMVEAEVDAGYSRNAASRTISRKLSEAIDAGEIAIERISIRETAEAFLGRDTVDAMVLESRGSGGLVQTPLVEDGEAVDNTSFSNITGQIVYTAVMQGYQKEGFIGDQLVTVRPTKLSGEKFPGMQSIKEDAEIVHDGMPYPYVGFGESFHETPETTKRGLAIALTKEVIFFDRTGLIVGHAQKVGERLGFNREKRILRVFVGVTNNYKFRGTNYATYLDVSPAPLPTWRNKLAGVDLVDWKSIEQAKLLFQDIRDPDNGEPILIGGKTLVVTPQREWTARRILGATEIRETNGANVTLSSNPVSGMGLNVLSSQLLLDILQELGITAAQAAKYWHLGDPKKAFAYMENWPLTVVQAPPNSEAEFERDIVNRWRVSERGVAAVWDPRFNLQIYDN